MVVVPETDLDERVLLALMAALANDEDERERIRSRTVYRAEEPGFFETFSPDGFYYVEHLNDGRFALAGAGD